MKAGAIYTGMKENGYDNKVGKNEIPESHMHYYYSTVLLPIQVIIRLQYLYVPINLNEINVYRCFVDPKG